MSSELPEYYFRVRENGATVFRIDTENQNRRIEMEHIAVVNVKNGSFRPHRDRVLSVADKEAIQEWMASRQSLLKTRNIDDIHRAVDFINLTTQWAQSKASDDELEEVTDRLLLSMHDLRSVLTRKKADRLQKNDG